MQAQQAGTGEHGLGRYAPVRCQRDVRPDRALLCADGAEIDVPGLARQREVPAVDLDQCGGTQAGTRSEHDLGAAKRVVDIADLAHPFRPHRRQGQRLGLEIVEDQALLQVGGTGDLGTVDGPARVGHVHRAAMHRTRGAGDHRPGPCRKVLDRVGDRGLEAGIVTGGEMLRIRRVGAGLFDEREARIGAADVANQNRKREMHGRRLLGEGSAPP